MQQIKDQCTKDLYFIDLFGNYVEKLIQVQNLLYFQQSFIQHNSFKKQLTQLSMCIISKKLKCQEIRQKRTNLKKKLQIQMNSPILKKLMFNPDQVSSNQNYPQTSSSDIESVSQDNCIQLEKKNNLNDFEKRFELLQRIGEGANTSVHKCRERSSSKLFAVKVMRFRDQELIVDFQNQFQNLKTLSHVNIIGHQDLIVDNNRNTSYAILEHCDFKNLKEELFSRPDRKLPETEVIQVIQNIIEALEFLHAQGVAHRDLKSQNILYNPQNGQIKIIDFDCAKFKSQNQPQFEMWTKNGTLFYQAPEIFLNTTFSEKVDMWGLGVIAYELLTGKLPFQSLYQRQAIKQIISSEIGFQSLKVSENLKALLKGLLERQPICRFSAKEALTFLKKSWTPISKKN